MFRILWPLLYLMYLRLLFVLRWIGTTPAMTRRAAPDTVRYADEILKANVCWTASSQFALFYHLIPSPHISPLLVVSISRILLRSGD